MSRKSVSSNLKGSLREKVQSLRRKGFSFREIARRLDVSAKTAWRHGKGTDFSEEGRCRYETEVTGTTKEISRQEEHVTEEKARIIAHLLFDGSLYRNEYHYNIRYTNASKSLVREFVNDMLLVYSLGNPYWEISDGKEWYRVTYRSKEAYGDLLSYIPSFYSSDKTSKVPREIMEADRNIRLEVLRAFWRDEGSIASSGKLTAELRSKRIIYQLKLLHEKFNLYPRIAKYVDDGTHSYKLYFLKGREILRKFHKLNIFGPSLVVQGAHAGRKKANVLKNFLE